MFYAVLSCLKRSERLEVVLIREDLLPTLSTGHTLLLLLTSLRRSHLLLSLLFCDRVSERIVLDLLLADDSIGLVNARARSLPFNPVVAGGGETTVGDGPDLGTNVLGELAVLYMSASIL